MRLSHTPYICSFRHYTPAGCCSCVPPPAIFHVHICISPTLMTFIGNRKGANIHQCRAINSSNAHIHKSACKATISHPFVHIIFNANGKWLNPLRLTSKICFVYVRCCCVIIIIVMRACFLHTHEKYYLANDICEHKRTRHFYRDLRNKWDLFGLTSIHIETVIIMRGFFFLSFCVVLCCSYFTLECRYCCWRRLSTRLGWLWWWWSKPHRCGAVGWVLSSELRCCAHNTFIQFKPIRWNMKHGGCLRAQRHITSYELVCGREVQNAFQITILNVFQIFLWLFRRVCSTSAAMQSALEIWSNDINCRNDLICIEFVIWNAELWARVSHGGCVSVWFPSQQQLNSLFACCRRDTRTFSTIREILLINRRKSVPPLWHISLHWSLVHFHSKALV